VLYYPANEVDDFKGIITNQNGKDARDYAHNMSDRSEFKNIYHSSAFKDLLLISKHKRAILIKLNLN